ELEDLDGTAVVSGEPDVDAPEGAVARGVDALAVHRVPDDHALGAELAEGRGERVAVEDLGDAVRARPDGAVLGGQRAGWLVPGARLAVEPATRREVLGVELRDPVAEHAGVREHVAVDDRD